MKRIAAIASLLFLMTAWAAAQAPPQEIQQETFYVSAEGRFESAPDTALINFTIGAQAETSEAAYARASKAAEQMRRVLRNNNIDPKTAEVGYYAINPVFDWKSPKRRVLGYRVTTSVNVKVKDFAKVGPLSQQLAAIEDTDNQSLSYTLDDVEAAKAKAIEDAYRRARNSAEAVARAAQRKVGALTYASVDAQDPVRIMPMMQARTMKAEGAAADAAPMEGFSEQKITVTARVTALFRMQ